MIRIVTEFKFSMIPGASNGSFEFRKINSDQARKLVRTEDGFSYRAYIPDPDLAEAVKRDLAIRVVKDHGDMDFYDNDECILVKNKNNDLLGEPIPEYFHFIIHSDGVPCHHPNPFDEI